MATPSTHTVRTAPGQVVVDLTGMGDSNRGINIQPDGKVLVAGHSTHISYSYPGSPLGFYETRSDYSLMRLNADGTLDTSFGTGGVVVVDAEVDRENGTYVSVQSDGKILASESGAVQRFNTDGTADTSFGDGGKVVLDYAGAFNDATAITAGADGSLYVTGISGTTLAVTKLNADGSADTTYGDNGTFLFTDAGKFEGLYTTTVVQPDGSVLFAGDWSAADNYAYSLVRVTADGERDTSFGDNGKLVFDPSLGLNVYSALAVQPDGKIIVVGDGDSKTGTVVRLNSDGSLDTSFGENGRAYFAPAEGYSNNANAVTVQADGKILVSGSSTISNGDFSVTRFNADGSLDLTFGSQDGKHHVDGYTGQDNLLGTDAAEVMRGFAGDDVLQGAGGRDVLYSGEGADIFRFTAVDDSYRTATTTASDRIQDFNASEDRIDLIGLGFTGLGDGLDGTLAVQLNAEGTRTYLKSFEANAAGERFELVLEGNWLGQLDSSNVVFTPPVVQGTAGADVIRGTAMAEELRGLEGNDRINGGAGDDVLIGGKGRDVLNGEEGADTYLYTSVDESYRTDTESFSDVIVQFDRRVDTIDLSALGYTGYGDGTGTTLKVSYNDALDRTYLKDLEADAQGHRFELTLDGDWQYGALRDTVVFAPAAPTAETAEVELIGVQTTV